MAVRNLQKSIFSLFDPFLVTEGVSVSVYPLSMPKRLDPAVAIAVMRESGLEPLIPYPGAAKPWKVKCNFCGTIGTPTYAHVNNRGGGCKQCGRVRTADAKRKGYD